VLVMMVQIAYLVNRNKYFKIIAIKRQRTCDHTLNSVSGFLTSVST
jgi:hypothetical protein